MEKYKQIKVWGVQCNSPKGTILQVGIASNFRTITDGNQIVDYLVDVKTALYGVFHNIKLSTLNH